MDERSINRHRVSHAEMVYVNFLSAQDPEIVTAFNSSVPLKRFGRLLPDAYKRLNDGSWKIYFFHDEYYFNSLIIW